MRIDESLNFGSLFHMGPALDCFCFSIVDPRKCEMLLNRTVQNVALN